jgi:hypothetical protein
MKIRICIAAVAVTQLFGCASIVSGQNQSVSINAMSDSGQVVGAQCTLTNNKGTWYVMTPGTTTVHRSYGDLGVRCEKKSESSGVATVKSHTKGMAFGNILFGGIIGAGVDMKTGAAYDYPTLITVLMGRIISIGTPASPQSSPSITPMNSSAGNNQTVVAASALKTTSDSANTAPVQPEPTAREVNTVPAESHHSSSTPSSTAACVFKPVMTDAEIQACRGSS